MQLPFRFARSCKAYSDKQHEPKDLGSSGSSFTQTIAAYLRCRSCFGQLRASVPFMRFRQDRRMVPC